MSSLISRLGAVGYRDGQIIEVAGWPVRLAVNPRARRISLRIDRSGREAIANAPSTRRLSEAAQFARSRGDWIGKRLASLPEAIQLRPGLQLDFLGAPLRLVAAPGRARLDLTTGVLSAPDDAAFGVRALRLLKAEARRDLTDRTARYAARLNQPMPTVCVADARRRWGSCSPPRRGGSASIRYSWRLSLAPTAVADYVAAHECAHLLAPHHGPGFWALVREIYGETAQARAWLNLHGDRLHAVTV